MGIRVALNHKTTYTYDRLVSLSPQSVRLRPAPHCRTPILSYALQITPTDHFLNWQQDPQGNYLARLSLQRKTRELRVEMNLVAEITTINPFDFFIEESAEIYPFSYETWLAKELKPFLDAEAPDSQLTEYLGAIDRTPRKTVEFLVNLNGRLQRDIQYLIRLEPGVQTPAETLNRRSGSCAIQPGSWCKCSATSVWRHVLYQVISSS